MMVIQEICHAHYNIYLYFTDMLKQPPSITVNTGPGLGQGLGLKVKSTVIYNYVFIIGVLTPLAKPIVL